MALENVGRNCCKKQHVKVFGQNFCLGWLSAFKVLEYLRTCKIFYLINGPRVTFGNFD